VEQATRGVYRVSEEAKFSAIRHHVAFRMHDRGVVGQAGQEPAGIVSGALGRCHRLIGQVWFGRLPIRSTADPSPHTDSLISPTSIVQTHIYRAGSMTSKYIAGSHLKLENLSVVRYETTSGYSSNRVSTTPAKIPHGPINGKWIV
jgi:hypothetical protein